MWALMLNDEKKRFWARRPDIWCLPLIVWVMGTTCFVDAPREKEYAPYRITTSVENVPFQKSYHLSFFAFFMSSTTNTKFLPRAGSHHASYFHGRSRCRTRRVHRNRENSCLGWAEARTKNRPPRGRRHEHSSRELANRGKWKQTRG